MPKGIFKRIIGINCGFNKGKHWKIKDTSKMKLSRLGSKNPAYKESGHAYNYLHSLIRNLKGKAIKCSKCGESKKRITYANKNHKYSRNPKDYIALCLKCHWWYDVKNNGKIHYKQKIIK